MSQNHLGFTAGTDCANCHSFTSWTAVTFDHSVVSNKCFDCHNGTTATSKGLLTTKTQNHIASGNDCESCHSTTTWKTAFDHGTIGSQTCVSCHNGLTATGKLSLTGKHFPTNDTCQNCHNTTAWAPIQVMDHGSATGTCYSCHDGAHSTRKGIVTPRSGSHLPTSNACASCHTTTTWSPLTGKFDHTQALGTCFGCHDGNHAPASKRSDTHIISSTDCAECHTTAGWTPAAFSHLDTTVAATSCVTCHDGHITTAASKLSILNHPMTSDFCTECHTTSAFKPARMKHDDPVVASQNCTNCHLADRPPTHGPTQQGECSDCHRTASWATNGKPANHDTLTTGCFNCHNGTSTARAKSPTHFTTSTVCEACHNTTSFSPARFDHAETTITTCISCHDGAKNHSPAQSKLSIGNHPVTSNDCQNCHSSYTTWRARFSITTIRWSLPRHATAAMTATMHRPSAIHRTTWPRRPIVQRVTPP